MTSRCFRWSVHIGHASTLRVRPLRLTTGFIVELIDHVPISSRLEAAIFLLSSDHCCVWQMWSADEIVRNKSSLNNWLLWRHIPFGCKIVVINNWIMTHYPYSYAFSNLKFFTFPTLLSSVLFPFNKLSNVEEETCSTCSTVSGRTMCALLI